MTRIPDEDIEQVKQATDLAAYIRSRGVELKRKGKQFVGLCPFHDDHSPSLIVDPKKNLWTCLGACGTGGDVYSFVMRAEGCDFREAHRLLGEKAKGRKGEKEESQDPRVQELVWLERYVAHCHQRFLESPAAQEYVTSRGIGDLEAWRVFRLGYADGSVAGRLSAAGRETLTRLGVLTTTGQELMEGCVIFPLLNPSHNQPVSLYGRHLERPQHLYLPGERHGVFHPQGAKLTDEVILTESVIDAAALWSAGMRNVMALYGVNGLTQDIKAHLKECRVKSVVLMLDNDPAGREAIPRLTAELAHLHITARSVALPAKDPSDFLTSGGSADHLRVLLEVRSQPAEGSSLAAGIAEPAGWNPNTDHDGSFTFTKGTRSYRVRGVTATGLDRLKVNLRLSVNGAFHLDTFDLYQSRGREVFAERAAKRLGLSDQQVEADLLELIEPLEKARLELRSSDGNGKPTTGAAPMTAEERQAALEYLKAPRLTERIVEDFTACGLVGEEASLLAGHLALLSRKLDKPLSLLVVARSGAGKSSLQDALCAFVPPEELMRVTRLTGQALFYKDPYSLQHKVLAVAEEEGAQQAIYSLRTLASDQRLSIAATRTDPKTGKLATDHYELYGPTAIIITTTSPEAFDEETRNRFVQLTMDESRAQTRAILERQRRRYTLEGVLASTAAERIRRLHHNLQRLIRPVKVVNPFVERLRYPDERLIARREQEKYLSLINAIALLHQHQRPVKKQGSGCRDEVEYVEVTPQDLEIADRLARDVLARAFDELAPPVRGMWREVRKLFEQRAEETGFDLTDEVRLSRRDLRTATGWTDWQVRVYCQKLVDMEYLGVIAQGNGKPCLYKLLEPLDDDSPTLDVSAGMKDEG